MDDDFFIGTYSGVRSDDASGAMAGGLPVIFPWPCMCGKEKLLAVVEPADATSPGYVPVV